MINAVQIAGATDNIYYGINGMPIKYINHLNKVNVFIGENNSGKSKMMRLLVNSDMVKILSNDFVKDDTNDCRNSIINNLKLITNNTNYDFQIDNNNDMTNTDFYCCIQEKIDMFKNNYKSNNYPVSNYISHIDSQMNRLLEILCRENKNVRQTSISARNPIYIPILRGIENFNIYFEINNNNDDLKSILMNQRQRDALEKYKTNVNQIYQNKIKKAYGIKEQLIFTAENLYEDITNKLLGKEDGRIFIKEFQNFISQQFYNGNEFTLIPQKDEGFINVKIGNQERPLHELGDGIKQLITILYVIYENKDRERVFFIEEPELNLHPGFQRRLMEILHLDIFAKHQYFITTHSNHLIDSCFDYSNISIFKFTNIDNSNNRFRISYTLPNDITILESLGVNNSSVFMANCTIWVEGISDKILIKRYLEVYFENEGNTNYKEDINYAFVEYGGNNITHWDFESTNSIDSINTSGITNRSFIICDNDNDSKNKSERKKKLKDIFKDNFYELTVREIENTISKEVLERTLFDGKEVKYKKKYEEREYKNKETYMGSFIDDHYLLSRKYSKKGGTGTILNKVDFSKRIAKNIIDYNDLSRQAINICKKIVKFIEESNN
ncbi:MAG: ATP-binding protein [Clostridia bacterium]|nr:ATP-binding protein [Bacilli bacterium]MBR3511477.1 ATP-binding protein [Clostridia bacterium]